ncbi:MAG: hypothetical protein FWG44_05330 [Oscillospiraceae bacterium]|nr:hypothetical protein [Oscillospiraceae bacterium]
MKKCILTLTAVFFLLTCSLTVYADVLIEPVNNFYELHKRNILRLDRAFTVNGESGYAHVKKEPGAKNDLSKIENNKTIFISYSCLYDGDFWGYTFGYNTGHAGWIKMNQLLVLYDYIAFEEDHADEFYRYEGDYGEIKETDSAFSWAFPGADAPEWTFQDLDMNNFRVNHAYTDEYDREWGFVSYLYGSRNIWVCLSEPLNQELPAYNAAHEPIPWVSDTAHVNIPKSANSTVILIIVLVAALVIGTGILIKVVWKPNKTKTGGNDND